MPNTTFESRNIALALAVQTTQPMETASEVVARAALYAEFLMAISAAPDDVRS